MGAATKFLDAVLTQMDEAGERMTHLRHPILHAAGEGIAHAQDFEEEDYSPINFEDPAVVEAGFNPFRGLLRTTREMGKQNLDDLMKRGARQLVEEPFKEVDEALKRFKALPKKAKPTWRPKIKGGKGWTFNLDHLEGADDVLKIIKETSEMIDEPKKVISWADTEVAAHKLADYGGVDPKQVMNWARTQGVNAEQLELAKIMMMESAELVQDATDFIYTRKASGALTDADMLGYMQIVNRHFGIQKSVSGMKSEAGRTLNIMKRLTGAQGITYNGQVRDLLNVLGGDDHVRTLIDMLADADTTDALNKMTAQMSNVGWKDMAYEIWINGLLSGARTQEVNFFGSGLATLVGNIDQVMAGGIGDMRGLATYMVGRGHVHHANIKDMLPYMYGELKGTIDGLRIAARSMRTGTSAFDPSVKMEARVKGGFNPAQQPAVTVENLARLTGRPIPQGTLAKAADYFFDLSPVGGRLPTRFLVSADDYWKAINYRAHLHVEAYRMARAEALEQGIKDQAEYIGRRAPELISDMPQELHHTALQAARVATFTDDPTGPLWGGLMGLAQGVRSIPVFGKMVVPFARTPVDLAKWATHHTPAALVDSQVLAAIRAGGPQADVALGKIATGSTIGIIAGLMYSSGFITGAGPTEKRGLSAAERRLGIQKRSLRVPKGYYGNEKDEFYDISRTDPVGMLLTIVADTLDVMAWSDDEATLDEIAGSISIAIAENFTSKTYLTGVADFFEAWVSDPKRFMGQWVEKLSGSMVPTLVADVNKHFFDKTQREVDGILNSWRSRIPGLSKSLPPRRNLWGYEITRDHFNMFNPFQYSEFAEKSHTDLDVEIYMNRWNITKPSPNWAGLDLRQFESADGSRNAYDRYVELQGHIFEDERGMTLEESLLDLVRSDYYRKELTPGPDGTQKIDFMSEIIWFREQARLQLLQEFPDLGLAAEEKQRKQDKARGLTF